MVSTNPVNIFALDAKIGFLNVSLAQRSAEVGWRRLGNDLENWWGRENKFTKMCRQVHNGFYSHSPCHFCEYTKDVGLVEAFCYVIQTNHPNVQASRRANWLPKMHRFCGAKCGEGRWLAFVYWI